MEKDFLLELGTEEIPARFLPEIIIQYEKIALQKLKELRVAFKKIEVLATPRRLVLFIKEIADKQLDDFKENKGPSVKIAFDNEKNPTKACEGFAKGQGVAIKDLVIKDGYVYAQIMEKGVKTEDLLAKFSSSVLSALNFPKNMRWGDSEDKFVRPVHWILALYDRQNIKMNFCGINSDKYTSGHRFLGEKKVLVESTSDYFEEMKKQFVVLDQNERRELIKKQISSLAKKLDAFIEEDEALLEEVVYLVEYPTVLFGNFDKKYLKMPEEVIVTPMREHQRYFPVRNKDGGLLPIFVTVRNGNDEYLEIVKTGNERVLSARLADAAFFFEEDKKVKLEHRVEGLKKIVFQEGLGTMYDKTVRLGKIAAFLAQKTVMAEKEQNALQRAALLAKTDLQTGIVYEFTELQGIMGRNYAYLEGEESVVCEAIFEHYLPRFAGDVLPKNSVGRLLSIAEKTDNLVASFSRGLIPSGSQDPYALRRQALGIVLIIIDGKITLSLSELTKKVLYFFDVKEEKTINKVITDMQEFFKLRLKNIFTDMALRYDLTEAILNTDTDDLYDAWQRALALKEVAEQNNFSKNVEAFMRIFNMVKNEKKFYEVKQESFIEEEEKALFVESKKVFEKVITLKNKKAYLEMFLALEGLVQPINSFFDKIMVMAKEENLRFNRIALLQSIAKEIGSLFNVTKIVNS